jgi:hypothetical protein
MPIEDIFQEYVRMRGNGLETQEALKALRLFVEVLPKDQKEALAVRLRQWEKENANGTRLTEVQTFPSHAQPLVEDTNVWVQCPNCGKKNRMTEIFCYACGHLLDMARLPQTQHFADGTGMLYGEEYYGEDSVVEIVARDSGVRYEVRPQLRRHELVIGRSANGSMPPDVDLVNANGADLGVSRIHLAMRYEGDANNVHIYDLGSANGSYINGQRLQPRELRVLRSGDELRLGRLVLRVKFLHPGDKLS